MSETNYDTHVDDHAELKVYVHDHDYEWLPGVIVDSDGNSRVKVRIQLPHDWRRTTVLVSQKDQGNNNDDETATDEERWVDLNDYYNHHLPLQNDKGAVVRDIAELANLHEAAILYQVKERHAQQKPYTRVGDIVIAVNPCEWITGLYSLEMKQLYAGRFVSQQAGAGTLETTEEKKVDDPLVTSSTSFASWYERLGHEPHIYEVSASAYRGLAMQKQDQIILVSGESGAGKTETVKKLLDHLSTIETAALYSSGESRSPPANRSSEQLIRHIVESSPIFEAFGNAKTCRNDNSSRFGKVTKLHFQTRDNGVYSLRGSTCETYLLETSRVVTHTMGERSFHIFYQMLAAPPVLKICLVGPEWEHLQASDFRYLSHSGSFHLLGSKVTDSELAIQTIEALQLFQWTGGALRTLMDALLIVLRLGNIEFMEHHDGYSTVETRDQLADLSYSMGIDEDEIEQAMVRRSLRTNQDEVTVPLRAEYAKEGCDALAKKLYSCIFDAVVRSINDQTRLRNSQNNSKESQSNTKNNIISLVDIFGFESFDVNRFEQLCINYANEKLQNKYVMDNLNHYRIEYEKEGLDLFDFEQFDNTPVLELLEGPLGVINTLSEESVRLSGTNEAFVFKVKKNHRAHKSLIDEKLHLRTEFGVRHFASPVVYDTSGFVERNTDKQPQSLLHLATRSANMLIATEFGEILREHEAELALDAKRKNTMKMTVMEKFRLQLTELMAVMKDSHTRYIRCIKPNESLAPRVVEHNVIMRQLRCAGLITAVEMSREAFPNKLSFKLVEERFGCLLTPEHKEDMLDMEPDEKAQYMMNALFAPVIKQYRASDFTMPIAVRRTRVYYRAGALEILESWRIEFFSAEVTIIQKWIRAVLARLRERAVVKIQAITRGHQVRKRVTIVMNAIVMIQKSTRRTLCRNSFFNLRKAGRVLASFGQTVVFVRRLKQRRAAATRICCWYRTRNCVEGFSQIRQAAVVLQASARSWIERCNYLAFRELQRAATVMQAVIRSGIQRRMYARQLHGVILIQSHTRSAIERRSFLQYVESVVVAQAVIRSWLQRLIYGKERRMKLVAATTIQSHLRRFQQTRRFKALKRSAQAVQAEVRGHQTRNSISEASHIVDLSSQERSAPIHKTIPAQPAHFPKVLKALPLNPKQPTPGLQSPPRTQLENRLLVEKDREIARLMEDSEHMKQELESLREEMVLTSSEAEFHAQERESEFQEALTGYEDEVLQLKKEIDNLKQEKQALQEQMQAAQETHEKNMKTIQKGIQKTQKSHRLYLDKIMGLIDDTETSQKLETSRIREELEAVKREKDRKIEALKEELRLLHEVGIGGGKNKKTDLGPISLRAQKLSRKLYAHLAPDNILLVVKEAQQQPGPSHRYVEDRLSANARKIISYMEELVYLAEDDVEHATQKLQQKLVLANVQLDQLQGASGVPGGKSSSRGHIPAVKGAKNQPSYRRPSSTVPTVDRSKLYSPPLPSPRRPASTPPC